MYVIQLVPGIFVIAVKGDVIEIGPKLLAKQFDSILDANNFRSTVPALMIRFSTVEEL